MFNNTDIVLIAEKAAESLVPELLGSLAARLPDDILSAYTSLLKHQIINAIADAIAELKGTDKEALNMIYLSTPCRDDLDMSRSIDNHKVGIACLASLLKAGYKTVCPAIADRVVHNHGLADGWDSEGLRDDLVSACGCVVVAMSEGWQADPTMLHDIRCAARHGKPVFYLELDEFNDDPCVLFRRIEAEFHHDKYQPKDAPQPSEEPVASAPCC